MYYHIKDIKRPLAVMMLLLLAVFSPAAVSAVETAQQIIAKCASAVNNAPSLTVKMVLNTGGEQVPVDMTISKQKFYLDMPQMTLWYDGTTQWSYIKDTRELNITEPTTAELMECNPFAILNHYSDAYDARRLSDKESVIELVARDRSASVRRAVVTISPTTHLPSKVVVTLSNGRTFTATVSSIKRGNTLPASTFTYDRQKFPAAEIVDLR